jgi:putative serine/threonine protein kinase
VVYLTGNYAIKQFHERFRYNFLKEVKFLTLLQPFFFVPRLYFIDFQNCGIVMERLEGRRFEEIPGKKAVERALQACFILDCLGIEKQEMNHPKKHINF